MRTIFVTFFVALFCYFSAFAQGFRAMDDITATGPYQTVKKDVIANDTVPCDNHLLSIPYDPLINPNIGNQGNMGAWGEAYVSGDNIVFTPNPNHINSQVYIKYVIACGLSSDTAVLMIDVTPYNNPANIVNIDEGNTLDKCFDEMKDPQSFDIRLKYRTECDNSHNGGTGCTVTTNSERHHYPYDNSWIDGFTIPMVGDLNGDGKPEIVVLGITDGEVDLAGSYGKYINIYNGQNGNRLYKYDLNLISGFMMSNGWFRQGSPYHRSPSLLAIARLDKSNTTASIIVCNPENGKVVALNPVFNGSNITSLSLFWSATVSFNAPIAARHNATNRGEYRYPHPYIADLNGDGIPEIIVYNKIYNGSNGKLLMSWGGNNGDTAPVSGWYKSNITSTNYMTDYTYENQITQAASNKIKGRAMMGCRIGGKAAHTDRDLAVPAIVDIDGDGQQEIVTGNRIYKFQFNNMEDHTQNYYTMIDGPNKVDLPSGNQGTTTTTTYYLNDGFTRVADIDGDGVLDIIVATYANVNIAQSENADYTTVLLYVWSLNDLSNVKAAVTYRMDNDQGRFGIPFIGDINGKPDGTNNKKLPEICIVGGAAYINKSNSYYGRTGIKFHPNADNNLTKGQDNNYTSGNFNKQVGPSATYGHILGLTYYDDPLSNKPEDRLRLSWAMEHNDRSDNTGITLFDFNNDDAADLCYRDEHYIRVISPKISGKDYITYSATSSNDGILFKTECLAYTGFEAPAIADVNMDGSADIIVTRGRCTDGSCSYTNTNPDTKNSWRPHSWIEVYEYKEAKWAPCPPVWNQGMYDPLQVREDLSINASPLPMLTKFWKNSVGDSIQPYNGSWIQRSIVRYGSDSYDPVIRQPNAVITYMKVSANTSSSNTTVKIVVKNAGLATIPAGAPIRFYNGGTTGNVLDLKDAPQISQTFTVPDDIFPTEKDTITLVLNSVYNNQLLYVCLMIDNKLNMLAGYDDCDPSNNWMDGADCPVFKFRTDPDDGYSATVCGTDGYTFLKVTHTGIGGSYPNLSYQWYHNDIPLKDETNPTVKVTRTGAYKCFLKDISGGVCRGFSDELYVTLRKPDAKDDYVFTTSSTPVTFTPLSNDNITNCSPIVVGLVNAVNGEVNTGRGTAMMHGIDSILYTPVSMFTGVDTIKYHISGEDTARIFIFVNTPHVGEYYACDNTPVTVRFDNVQTGMTLELFDSNGVSKGLFNPITSLPTSHVKDNVVKTGQPVDTFWVGASMTVNGTVIAFNNRLPVKLILSDNCGGVPVGCAIEGSLIWNDDFQGNAVSDHALSLNQMTAASDYVFKSSTPAGSQSGLNGAYWLLKTNTVGSNSWFTGISDHTHSGTTDRGYMLMADAGTNAMSSRLYEQNINVCGNTRMYFSLYAASLAQTVNPTNGWSRLRFELSAKDQNNNDIILATFATGDIKPENGQFKWRFYGFPFIVPAGQQSVKLTVYNNSQNTQVLIDDIEVRLCVSQITAYINGKSADTLCAGDQLTLGISNNEYQDDGTLVQSGSNDRLVGEWLQSNTGNINDNSWTTVSVTGSGNQNPVQGTPGYQTLAVPPVTASAPLTSGDKIYYRFVVSSSGSSSNTLCRAASQIVSLAVYPALIPGTAGSDQTVCTNGTLTPLGVTPATGSDGTYTYEWESSFGNNNSWTTTGVNTEQYPFSSFPQVGDTYYRRKVTTACGYGYSDTVKITVNQAPEIATQSITQCSGAVFTFTPQSTDIVPSGTTYTWTVSSNSLYITGASPQTTPQSGISQTLTNSSTATEFVTYTIVPVSGSCTGSQFIVNIAVNPQDALTLDHSVPVNGVCSGTSVNFTATSLTTSTITWSWIRRPAAGITPAPSGGGSGNHIDETLVNSTLDDVNVTYVFTLTANGCTNIDSVEIPVTPVPVITAMDTTICSLPSSDLTVTPQNGINGSVPNAVRYQWQIKGTPNSNITGGNFSSTSSYESAINLSRPVNNTSQPQTEILEVTPFTAGATGYYCSGAAFDLTVTVSPVPKINVGSKYDTTICSGGTFNIVPTDGGGDIVPSNTQYTWTVTQPNSLGATDETTPQNSISQTLSHSVPHSQDITYTVTPIAGSCEGSPFTVKVTVSPIPNINDTATTICSGSTFVINPLDGISGNTVPSGTTYTWTVSTPNPNITGAANENSPQSVISQTLTNLTNSPQSVIYTVNTKIGTGTDACTGNQFILTVTVNPVATVNHINDTTVCNGATVPGRSFTTPITGATVTYDWSIDSQSPNIGLSPTSGSGNIPQFTASITGISPITANITVTPKIDSCYGIPQTFTVTVRPAAVYSDIRIMLCPEPSPRIINLNSYVDTLYSQSIKWSKTVSSSPDVSVDGRLNTQNFKSGTHVYSYKVNNGCDSSSGRVYIRTLPGSSTAAIPDTIAICKDVYAAQYLNLNRMFGLEVSGDWVIDPTISALSLPQQSDYISQPDASSKFHGAVIFNGKKAFDDNVGTQIIYHSDTQAKMFVFKYIPHGNCLSGDPRKIIVVITSQIVQ
ncbi:MAG: hypothetical protein LBH32_03400 [Dysgonamonadaceae bacterium]|jgi:hypothetical protein|nr:hypothetical protein [Dysgonamonadaceae bacterium]